MKRLLLLVIISVYAAILPAYSQIDTDTLEKADTLSVISSGKLRFQDSHTVSEVVPPDSIDVARYRKKHFWRAAGEIIISSYSVGKVSISVYGRSTVMCLTGTMPIYHGAPSKRISGTASSGMTTICIPICSTIPIMDQFSSMQGVPTAIISGSRNCLP